MGSGRFALRVMQAGAVAVVLAASLHRGFELDRFLVPKELALHLTAVIAGLGALRILRGTPASSPAGPAASTSPRSRGEDAARPAAGPAAGPARLSRIDVLLFAWLLLGALSVAFAQNRWVGVRALAVSASAAVMFWVARALRDAGLARPLLNAIAFAIVLAAITSLVQAYGVRLDLFAIDRAPGGTLGNRNFVGHAAAFGLPVLLFAALQASRRTSHLLASAGVAIVLAALVLTRSRAAWVACAMAMVVFLFAMLLRGDGRTWLRLVVVLLFAGGGVAAALLIPNTLRWRSDNPYLESIKGVASYDEGSGRGRLVQYERSLRMAASYPLLGVGPGNWPVRYPAHATRNDPSLNESEPGTTFNPWPSSDWISFVAERGFVPALLMLAVFAGLALSALRRIFAATTVEEMLPAATLLGTLVAAGAAGAFDAVLLLGAPALLVWSTIGALHVAPASTRGGLAVFVLIALALSAIGVARSASQLAAMEMYVRGTSLQTAARIDPGNYRLRLRLARSGSRKLRCGHARAAHTLFPNADAARTLARGCD